MEFEFGTCDTSIVFVPRSRRGTGVTVSTSPTTLTVPVFSAPTAKVTVPGLLTLIAGVVPDGAVALVW